MKDILFYKMQALANDFIIVPQWPDQLDKKKWVCEVAHRRLGIGADQIMFLSIPQLNGVVDCDIYNSDGSSASQCGNGLRCVAHCLHLLHQFSSMISIRTSAGLFHFTQEGQQWKSELGCPHFSPKDIPLNRSQPSQAYTFQYGSKEVLVSAVSIGNPHALIHTQDAFGDSALAEYISTHPDFPQGCNVGLMTIKNRHTITLQVHERGAGPTPACGSGACAAMAVAFQAGLVDEHVKVEQPGGFLDIFWSGDSHSSIICTGPAQLLYKGFWSLN